MPGAKRKRGMTTETGFKPSKTDALKRKQTRGRVTVPRNRLAFPQSLRTRLRYSVRTEFTLTNADAQVKTMRANDLFDPEEALGGHQPRGFDEMMAVYGKFTVISSKLNAQFMYEGYNGPTETSGSAPGLNLIQTISGSQVTPPATPALPPVCCGVHTGTEKLITGPAAEQMEKDRTSWAYLTPATGIITRSARASQKSFYGKEFTVGAEGYTGDDSTSPDKDLFYEVWAARLDDGYSAGNVRVPCYIIVEYDCVFTDPKTLSSS